MLTCTYDDARKFFRQVKHDPTELQKWIEHLEDSCKNEQEIDRLDQVFSYLMNRVTILMN